MFKIEVRNRQTGEWDIREEGDAKSRRAYLHSRSGNDSKSRHQQLRVERVQWRCSKD